MRSLRQALMESDHHHDHKDGRRASCSKARVEQLVRARSEVRVGVVQRGAVDFDRARVVVG